MSDFFRVFLGAAPRHLLFFTKLHYAIRGAVNHSFKNGDRAFEAFEPRAVIIGNAGLTKN
jgi:hypothetical protein